MDLTLKLQEVRPSHCFFTPVFASHLWPYHRGALIFYFVVISIAGRDRYNAKHGQAHTEKKKMFQDGPPIEFGQPALSLMPLTGNRYWWDGNTGH